MAQTVLSLSGVVCEHAENVSHIVKDQTDTVADLAREQADQVEQAENEQARPARQAERDKATQARERYEGLTKAELSDQLAERELPRTGAVRQGPAAAPRTDSCDVPAADEASSWPPQQSCTPTKPPAAGRRALAGTDARAAPSTTHRGAAATISKKAAVWPSSPTQA